MFSYLGSKSKFVDMYPQPRFDTIIEPFAGSARYSLKYFEKDVTLIEKFDKVARIWKYLKEASVKDVLGLPDIGKNEIIPTSLSDEERWLIGFCVGRGSARPCTKGHTFNNWNKDKIRIANDLFKIRHWKIINGDYADIENTTATWFIDPPYFSKNHTSGHNYTHSGKYIDYNELAKYCKSRNGHVLVCENSSAEWLPFVHLKEFKGIAKNKSLYNEVIWEK